ncbi:PEP-CTERM sorting domain-containing protein [Aquabacterium sp. OR-4]|uniref:PEP-CTERM sorting domain-containing protein n=1 Tax=Aquabacterium sp. OR-4 TaxID=2978127 RepID=UPI0028C5A724|nr:PEP-CTERM sorting domain-containing protein [Aquabacterium sp. OR-4]MDT7838828.1 PEP-CTERM sorting domain-containing protein [Aquabacterium sp. OR-4]
MRTPPLLASLLLAGAALAGQAQAADTRAGTLDIAFTNLPSTGLQGDADNSTLTYRLPAQAFITGLRWTVDVQAFDPSWLQELSLALTASNGEGVQFSPAPDQASAGSWQGQGSVDLLNSGLAFRLGGDGRLQLELYDAVDDLAGLADGRWRSATLQVAYTAAVPEPTSAALLLAGLLGVASLGARRRR